MNYCTTVCMREGCALGTGQTICVNQSGSETKWQLGFLNAPCRATALTLLWGKFADIYRRIFADMIHR